MIIVVRQFLVVPTGRVLKRLKLMRLSTNVAPSIRSRIRGLPRVRTIQQNVQSVHKSWPRGERITEVPVFKLIHRLEDA